MDTTVIVLIVVVVLLVAALAAVLLSRKRNSKRLQDHYGPEYERSLSETGDRKEAEARLLEREERHRSLDVRDLEPAERERYGASWNDIQRDFVDDPTRALRSADSLVDDVMRTRGYPVDDFERQAEDVSVEHPDVVRHYREARAVRDATEDGAVDTERQRHAVTSYRSLVEALLGHGDESGHRIGDRADRDRTDGSPVDRRAEHPQTEEHTR